jgi:hypothetical protein
MASSSSIGMMRQGHSTGEGTLHTLPHMPLPATASAIHRDIQHLGMSTYRPPLQLIQEAAPLSAAHASSLSTQASSQQQHLQRLAAGAPMQLSLLAGHPGGNHVTTVSRRISPILSVHEDASSATSTDSLTPAAWHLTDRQLLEDTPGWLNIDFSREVRLEKKLGEGGFGQVSPRDVCHVEHCLLPRFLHRLRVTIAYLKPAVLNGYTHNCMYCTVPLGSRGC